MTPEKTIKNLCKELRDEVRKHLRNTSTAKHRDRDCKKFLPVGAIGQIVVESKVNQILRVLLTSEENEMIDGLTYHFSVKAPRVFLTLVLSKAINKEYIMIISENKFSDDNLPIYFKEVPGTKGGVVKGEKGFEKIFNWESEHIATFCEKQWYFLAPVFTSLLEEKKYDLDPDNPLPFTPFDSALLRSEYPAISDDGSLAGEGGFGMVKKFFLFRGHYDQSKEKNDQLTVLPTGDFVVAVKTITLQAAQTPGEINDFYKGELESLRAMYRLNHPHLIKAIAGYEHGYRKHFIFPYADGGNLEQFWTRHGTRSEATVAWALRQMIGIAEGVRWLNYPNDEGLGIRGAGKEGTRHGDIKPANILLFNGDGNANNLGGTLVLADVGISKFNIEYTTRRDETMGPKFASKSYQSPEQFLQLTKGTPRNYDIWSLGCVYLEFITWIVDGNEGESGLNELRKAMQGDIPGENNTYMFWKKISYEPRKAEVNEAATKWMNERLKRKMKKDTDMWKLLDLIEKKLLVIVASERIQSRRLVTELEKFRPPEEITEEWRDKLGLFETSTTPRRSLGGDSGTPAPQALQPPLPRLASFSNQSTSQLDNKWVYTPNSAMFPAFNYRITNVILPDDFPLQTYCTACNDLDFDQPEIRFQRSAKTLKANSFECGICELVSSCLYRTKNLDPDIPVILFRNDMAKTFNISSPDGSPLVFVYTSPLAQQHQHSRLPQLYKPATREYFEFLGKWIQDCDKNHKCVIYDGKNSKYAAPRLKYMPTRVLSVGANESSSLRLVNTRSATPPTDLDCRYMALSHCWGTANTSTDRVCTYKSNIEDFEKNVPYESLPKTFQDAVRVTRSLGVPYLWIDSLCIIQDDEQDWASEAGRMEDVFTYAYCTVAASSAGSSAAGFLAEDRPPQRYLPVKTSRNTLYLTEAINDFKTHVEDSILNTRGWVLQERALSRRTLHFTSTQVYWECGNGIQCETMAKVHNPQAHFLGDADFPTSALDYYKDDRIRLVQNLFRTYSSLGLTRATDRARAIQGLETRLCRAFKSQASYGILWVYGERMILWQAEGSGQHLTQIEYHEGQEPPSWSWMTYSGNIDYLDVEFNRVNWFNNLQSEISQCEKDQLPLSKEITWDKVLRAKANDMATNDAEELQTRVILDRSDTVYDRSTWKCVVLGRSKDASKGKSMNEFEYYALIVRPSPLKENMGLYERVGVGKLLVSDFSSSITSTVSIT